LSDIVTKEYINTTLKLSNVTTTTISTIEEKAKEVALVSTALITDINTARYLLPAPTSTPLGASSPT